MTEAVRALVLCRSLPGGLMARRALRIAEHAPPGLEVEVVHRPSGGGAERALLRRLARERRPDFVVAYDCDPRELRAALLLRARGVPVALEIGDVAADVIRALGGSRARVARRRATEAVAWRLADKLLIRGAGFEKVLAERGVRRRAHLVPEGVDLERFAPRPPDVGRRLLGLREGDVAVGVVGTISWNPVPRTAYGWELVEALPRLPDHVRAVLIGGGDGVERLRARAQELGVAQRLLTPGVIAHDHVPEALAALDAVSWTQTPDALGRCRTTLKLPEYLASGRFIVASDVGAARTYVDGNGARVPYAGGRDPRYVDGVAAVLAGVARDPGAAHERGRLGVAKAAPFSWPRVAAAFHEALLAA
jgi:glycosyltransferase involved in cell wall biosynthesis